MYTSPIQNVENEISMANSFDSFGLHAKVLDQISRRGYTTATHIQDQVIPHIMSKKDVIGLAQTGSGKTGSYLIPLLHNLVEREKSDSNKTALIIVPTRELAFQVEKELWEFGIKYLGLYAVTCVGGMNIRQQITKLRKPNQFVIGTPGRLMDLAERNVLKLDTISTVVVDEVDRMLDMGFIDDINWIMDRIPTSRQGLFFSATFNKAIEPILKRLAPDASVIQIEGQKPSPFVEQTMLKITNKREKMDALLRLAETESQIKGLVFINTKNETERVAQSFKDAGFQTVYLHGGRSQQSRLRTIKEFKKMKQGFMVATDVAARGLDIDDITHVFNYDEPQDVETYIHRVGRTGRAGRYGKAVTLVAR